MDLSPLHAAVLEVLSGQEDSYLGMPTASCFVAIGLDDPEVVDQALIELQEHSYVEFFTEHEEHTIIKIVKDANGDPVLMESGEIEIEWHEETVKETIEIVDPKFVFDQNNPDVVAPLLSAEVEKVIKVATTEKVSTLVNAGWKITDEGREAFKAI